MSKTNSEKAAERVIKLLRQKKLSQGLPFMINSEILESNQCYMEYPDGSIKVVEADAELCDFRIVIEVSNKEALDLRKRLNLI